MIFPATLLAFFVSAVFSKNTSDHDPFRELAIRAPRQSDSGPVCCLRPLPSTEQDDDVLLLSFEEWKARQFAMQAEARMKELDGGNQSGFIADNDYRQGGEAGSQPEAGHNWGQSIAAYDSNSVATPPEDSPSAQQIEELSPHFRVPLTDRFNYASMDCSARVHAAHRTAKSSSAILSSKRDRYMLSPCAEQKQFVIVELCEDIRIDTVQLANFEFFSGVFRDFSVSVAKTYTTDAEGWVHAGTYKAKNVRGVQSFHPPTSLRDFYRFIRIDFHSHYSNEYYCPVSLLRVYGLTHLEQWKWDEWEAESRAKRAGKIESSSVTQTTVGNSPEALDTAYTQGANSSQSTIVTPSSSVHMPVSAATPTSTISSSGSHDVSTPVPSASCPMMEVPMLGEPTAVVPNKPIDVAATLDKIKLPSSNIDGEGSAPPSMIDRPATSMSPHNAVMTLNDYYETVTNDLPSTWPVVHSTDTAKASSPSIQENSPPDSVSSSVQPASEANDTSAKSQISIVKIHVSHTSSPSTPSSSTSLSASPPSSVVYPPPPPIPPNFNPFIGAGGESIYRTIINRLIALEANQSLYARYLEEQTSGVREVLRRLSEDVGRLEGITKAQSQTYLRTIREAERQRDRLELEYTDLVHRLNYLADEIILEKRLGIAQLCLLLAVLIFMGLTRGSRTGEPYLQPFLPQSDRIPRNLNKSVREWGRRHLSFSGDWTSRFRRARSEDGRDQSPVKESPFPLRDPPHNSNGADQVSQVSFPTTETQPSTRQPRVSSKSRSRTPSFRTPVKPHLHRHYQHNALGTAKSTLRRSNSQGGIYPPMSISASGSWSGPGSGSIGAVPRSAKKWARSAHLHQVRGMKRMPVNNDSLESKLDADEACNEKQNQSRGASWAEETDVFTASLSSNPRAMASNQKILDRASLLIYPKSVLWKIHSGDGEGDDDSWVDTDTGESVDGIDLEV